MSIMRFLKNSYKISVSFITLYFVNLVMCMFYKLVEHRMCQYLIKQIEIG